MIVHGFIVTPYVQCELIARMMRGWFTAHIITMTAMMEGVEAAQLEGFRWIGLDLSASYCQMAVKRMQNTPMALPLAAPGPGRGEET